MRKSRVADVSGLPWLIKLYAPDALYYFDYEESTRTATFEQALEVAAYFFRIHRKEE